MCSLLRFPDVSLRPCGGGPLGFSSVGLNDSDSTTRYLPSTPTLLDDWTTFLRSHALQVYDQTHTISKTCPRIDEPDAQTVQTWMFAGKQCDSALSSAEWKPVISSRGTEVGSGRRSPAEKDAFAMAI